MLTTAGIVVRLVIFVAGSSGIVRMSLTDLGNPRSHGFYRAFAFEVLLALVLLNISAWVRDPFSPTQLASWVLLLASAFLAIRGFATLRERGRPAGSVESTSVLVTSGVYRYIRHPLYASLLCLGWGVFLKSPTIPSTFLVAGASIFLFLTAQAEERENLTRFGTAYADYMRTTKRFIPFVF